MAPKSAHILFAILSVVAVAVPIVAAASRGPLAGGWQPIPDPKAPEVFAIAKFAVAEHNKENKTSLVLVSVLKGELQVVAGFNYRLLISTKHAAALKTYSVVVYSSPSRSLSLVSFEAIED